METFPTPTIVRTRGRVTGYTDVSSTPGGFGALSMGMILVTNTALAAGAGAIPSPLNDVGSDWLWIDSLSVGASPADAIGEAATVDRVIIDSKAMRKVGLNQALVFVAEWVTCEGTMVCNLCGFLRVLLKAP